MTPSEEGGFSLNETFFALNGACTSTLCLALHILFGEAASDEAFVASNDEDTVL